MNFLGAAKTGINIKHFPKCFNCPGKTKMDTEMFCIVKNS